MPKQARKLSKLAEKQGTTESEVLRHILDVYLKGIDKRGLPYEPFRKFSPVGLKTMPRTIRKEQDLKLREIAEKTGRKISELVREAVHEFY
ncbi:MAG: ribbon-helix-helix domain-containing protein [Candidatus Omnitrophota bacterium]